MKTFKIQYLLMMFAVVAIVLLPGCADNTPAMIIVQDPPPHVYGFWGGLWHGMIAFPDFFASLFWDDVTVYAQSNNGHWYQFGFLWGAGVIFGGSSSVVSKVRR